MSSPPSPPPPAPAVTPLPRPSSPSSRPGAARGALRAAGLLSVLYGLSRLTGLLQLNILNRTLKPWEASAYQAAFTLPDYVYYLVAGGALSVTFIPILAQLEAEGRAGEAERFFSALLGVMSAALLVLLGVCWLFAAPLTAFFNPGFLKPGNAATFELCARMTRIMLPAQWFFYTGGLLVAVLNARKRFGATGWTGTVYNLVALLVGVPLWFFLGLVSPRLGASGFAWGILVGAAVGYGLLPLVAYLRLPRAERLSLRPSFDWKQPAVRKFWINALPIMLGVSLPVVDVPIIKYFASEFSNPGALNYSMTAYRVMLAPLSIVAQAASVAAFPTLAANSANLDYQKLADFLRSGLRRLLFLSVPMSVVLMLNAAPLIRVLFGYGEFARDPQAVPQTALAFTFYCAGLFAWAGQALVARGYYALQDTRTPTIVGSILTVGFIGLCLFMRRWGVAGLAGATSIGATAHFSCILWLLGRKLKRRPYRAQLGVEKIAGALLRTGAACGPMALCGWLAARLCDGLLPHTKSGDLGRIAVVSLAAMLAFGLAAQGFAIPEWKWLRSRLRRN